MVVGSGGAEVGKGRPCSMGRAPIGTAPRIGILIGPGTNGGRIIGTPRCVCVCVGGRYIDGSI